MTIVQLICGVIKKHFCYDLVFFNFHYDGAYI